MDFGIVQMTVHELDESKIKGLYDDNDGKPLNKTKGSKEGKKFAEQMQFLNDRKKRMLEGKPIGTMEEEHIIKVQRKVLQLEKPLAINIKQGLSIGPSGADLQSRYVE